MDVKNSVVLHQDPSNTETQPPANLDNEWKPTIFSAEYTHTGEFHSPRTILVLNFLEEAEASVLGLLSRFGDMEIKEIIKDRHATTCLAVIQYKEVVPAFNALLAVPEFKVLSMNLDIRMLWDDRFSHRCHGPVLSENRNTVFIRTSNLDEEFVRLKCCQYGYVQQFARERFHNFTYKVVFHSALSAAVATYCLQASPNMEAVLLVGYNSNGQFVVDGPTCDKRLHEYKFPLREFQVNAIQRKFEDYSKLEWVLINLRRTVSSGHCFVPGVSENCARFYTQLQNDVSIYLDICLYAKTIHELVPSYEILTDCVHRSLCKLTLDFHLYKPITSREEIESNSFRDWKALFILDLEVLWEHIHKPEGLHVRPKMQIMNHVYSKIAPKVLNKNLASVWFGNPLRYRVEDASSKFQLNDPNMNLVRIMGYVDDRNFYQIPVDIKCHPNGNI